MVLKPSFGVILWYFIFIVFRLPLLIRLKNVTSSFPWFFAQNGHSEACIGCRWPVRVSKNPPDLIGPHLQLGLEGPGGTFPPRGSMDIVAHLMEKLSELSDGRTSDKSPQTLAADAKLFRATGGKQEMVLSQKQRNIHWWKMKENQLTDFGRDCRACFTCGSMCFNACSA